MCAPHTINLEATIVAQVSGKAEINMAFFDFYPWLSLAEKMRLVSLEERAFGSIPFKTNSSSVAH